MQKVEHGNLCRFHGISSDLTKPFLVMEYIPGCSLSKYVAHKDIIIEKEKLRIVLEIANGLEYLHYGISKGIVHGDLHPNNIMVQNNPNQTVKIVDFGLARSAEGTEGGSTISRDGRINSRYGAPEISEGEKENFATDVYAFGGVVNFVWTKKHPWAQVPNNHNSQTRIIRLQVQGQLPQLSNDSILSRSPRLRSCWDNDAASRPTITECKEGIKRSFPGAPVVERFPSGPVGEMIDWDAVERVVGKKAADEMKQGEGFTGELGLSDKSITDEGLRTIAPALRAMPNLKDLYLHDNNIGEEGCRTIAPALRTMTNLKWLNLDKNNIGDEGLRTIAPALRAMPNLEGLNLSLNNIGEEGCRTIAPALRTMTNLQELDLSGNNIGDEGCRTIAPALRTMTNLKGLRLSYNNIGDDSFAILCSRVLPEVSLEYLSLRDNKIGNVGCQSLLELVNNGSLRSLDELWLSLNPNISSELKEVFKRDWKAKGKNPGCLII